MNTRSKGMVVAAHQAGADAGARILAQGGSAVDAAIAVATVLAVVDPANCGIGGYGGCMLIHTPGNAGATQVDFNTRVPARFEMAALLEAGRSGRFVHGGPAVSFPAVVPGLLAAHASFGRLDFKELLQPAIRHAREGFVIGADLQANLAWAAARHQGLSTEFKSIFFSDGRPLRSGERLVQPELGDSLAMIAGHGEQALREGPLVEAICTCAAEDGGSLSARDFAQGRIAAAPAESARFRDAVVYGPTRATSGFGVLAAALESLEQGELVPNRGARYVEQTFLALQSAWNERHRQTENLVAVSRHTNHFCVADGSGALVSLTFTHGPLWFGSGLVAAGTGIVLNAGANLYVRSLADQTIFPMTNITPVVLACSDGSRHAMGSPGGIRIPAIVLQMVVDAVDYELPLAEAIALPRISVTAGGELEVESDLVSIEPSARKAERIETRHYYGPASALSVSAEGVMAAACDPRFATAVAEVTD